MIDSRSNEYRITLKGTLSHTVTLGADVFGNITRLDNALENLAGSLQAERDDLEETKAQLENARTELDTPFAREEELSEKAARLNGTGTHLLPGPYRRVCLFKENRCFQNKIVP